MSILFSASPDDGYKLRFQKKRDNWTAPEHNKCAAHVERAYPLDVNGRKMFSKGKEIVLERRPAIMIPERPKIFLGLTDPAA